MPRLHRRNHFQSPVGQEVCLSSHRRSTCPNRDLVYPRTGSGRTERVHHHAHPRSMAFRRKMYATLLVLRGHMAKEQRRSQRIAQSVHHRSPETSSRRCLLCLGRLRALVKMMLNSMWGKFGQHINKTQVREIPGALTVRDITGQKSTRCALRQCPDGGPRGSSLQTASHDVVPSPDLNIFVAAFTSCHVRLRLHQVLDNLGECALSFDIDSVVYLHRPDDPPSHPLRGAYLGDFKDELNIGDHIVEFCLGGPKNYGYETINSNTVCKVRGFSLNVEGRAQLNYDIVRQNTPDELHHPPDQPRTTRVTQSHTINRNSKSYTLQRQPTYKDYRLVDSNTAKTYMYPYGYESLTPEDLDLLHHLTEL